MQPLKHIKTYSNFLNEENETVMSSDAIRTTMFKLQKRLDPIYKKLVDKELLKNYESNINQYNDGWELVPYTRFDKNTLYRFNQEIAEYIDTVHTIYIYPDDWFDDDLQEGNPTKLDVAWFKNDTNRYELLPVKSKSDIKPRIRAIENEFIKQIKNLKN